MQPNVTFFLSCSTGRQTANTNTIHTHTAVSQQLHTLHNLAISSSSSRAYKSGLCRFSQFYKKLKHTVALFAADLSRSVAPRTARVYLVTVSLLHQRAGLQTPTRHNPSLQLALHRMAHYHSSQQTYIHKPINTSILNALHTAMVQAPPHHALCSTLPNFLWVSES